MPFIQCLVDELLLKLGTASIQIQSVKKVRAAAGNDNVDIDKIKSRGLA